MKGGTGIFLIAITLTAVSGCASPRRSEALGNPVVVKTAAEEHGRQVFMDNCYQCHTGGEGAVGPGINNKALPGFLIRMQVRNGLGAMPAFPADRISARDLDDLVAYLKAARRTGAS